MSNSDLDSSRLIETRRSTAARLFFLALLAVAQLPFLAFLFDPLAINNTDATWLHARAILREGVPIAVFFVFAMAIILTPKYTSVLADFESNKSTQFWQWIALNLVSFAVLSFLTVRLNYVGSSVSAPPWTLFGLWTLGVIALYPMLAFALAPWSFWCRTIQKYRWEIVLAAGTATFVQTAAILSRQSWNILSEATFRVSTGILKLYESDVYVDASARVIGANGFKVNIAAACSGYEGIGLVLGFLCIYMFIFRKELRFPNVYIVLPIGAVAIWCLNSVRIAMLVSIGAHFSEDVAIAGFHSQAGWLMFLIVTVGIMIATHKVSYFRAQGPATVAAPPPPAFKEAVFLLAPFLALLASGILTAAFQAEGEGQWLYSLRVAAISIVLLLGWRYYVTIDFRAGLTPVILGLVVGAAWIATDPGRDEVSSLEVWLSTLPTTALVAWLFLRVLGTALLVPLAEELAFRSYIHRKLVDNSFETVRDSAFTWKAFVISSVLFGLIHERWLAGALAGTVFAIALYRSGKIGGAIVAHIIANALIATWAITFNQWSLF